MAFGGEVPRAWPWFILALELLPGLGSLLVILRTTLAMFKLLSFVLEASIFTQMETQSVRVPYYYPMVSRDGAGQPGSGGTPPSG